MENHCIFCSFFQRKKLPCAGGITRTKRSKTFLSKCIILLLICTSFLAINDVTASHYRGGSLSWQQAGGNDITFTMNLQYRRDFYPTSAQNVGQTYSLGTFNFGSGPNVTVVGTITAIDIPNNQSFWTWTYTKTYPGPGTYNVSGLNTNARINTLSDANAATPYRLRSIVNVGSPFNNPPVTNLPAIINLPIGASAATFTVPATDPDNGPLTFRLSTTAESGMSVVSPPGFTLSSSGVATMNTIGRTIGQQYALQMMIEDGSTKTAVEVIIEMVGPSAPPVFVAPSPANLAVFNVTPPGNSVNFTMAANDPDVGQTTSLNGIALPPGATMTPGLPVTSAINGTAISAFSWTPTPAQVGTYVLNYVAQDNLGIQAFRSVTINVLCPLDITIDAFTDESCPGVSDGSATVSVQNASSVANLIFTWTGSGMFSSSSQNLTGLAPGTYNLRVDDIGNGCFTTETVTIASPNSAPMLATCSNISTPNDAGQCGAIVNFSNTTTGVPAPVITYSTPSGLLYPVGTTPITVTASNSCGTDNCTFTVTVTDDENPILICPADIAANNLTGLCEATVAVPAPQVTDNCSVLTLGNGLNFDGVDDIALVAATSPLNTLTQNKRTVEVYFKVDDKNINSRKQVVWEEGGNQNGLNIYVYNGLLYYGVYSNSLGWSGTWISTAAVNSGQWHNAVLVYDGTETIGRLKAYLDGSIVGSVDASPSLGTQLRFHPGANAVGGMQSAAIFHDGVDNSSTGNFFGGDIDEIRLWTIARTATELLATNTVQLSGTEPGLEVYYNFDQGIACGNNLAITTLNDIALPPLNGSLSGFALNGGCASNFTNGSPALNSSLTLTNSYTNTADASGTYPIGTTNVVWTATDASNNSVSCTQVITVTDNENPVLTCAANVAANNDLGVCEANVVVTSPMASDNCSNSGALHFDGVDDRVVGPNDVVPVTGEYTVAVWAKQTNNKPGQYTHVFAQGRNLYLGQNTVGVIRVGDAWINTGVPFPQDNQWHHYAIVRQTSNTHLYIDGVLKASKGSSIPSPGVNGPWPHNLIIGSQWFTTPGEVFEGDIDEMQIWSTALSAAQINCNKDMFLLGNEPNLVGYYGFEDGTGSTSLTNSVNASNNGSLENMDVNSAWISSNVVSSGVNLTNDYNNSCDASGVYPVGTTNVVWTATDASNNSVSCTQVITVTDNENPVLTCAADVTVNCQDDNSSAATGVSTATDNCGVAGITESDVSTQDPNAANIGHYNYTITRTWTATDVNSNVGSCAQLITVEDVTNPSVTCPADVTVNCQDDKTSAATGVATGSDNCSAVVITQSDVSTQDVNPANMGHYNYTIMRTWTATDVSGNASSCTQLITVEDVTNPSVTCPADVTVSCQDDKTSVATGVATGSDNCSAVVITESEVSTKDPNAANMGHYNYTITRTWTATDVSGNASSCTQLITVEDVTNPSVTCPADVTVSCQDDNTSAATGVATGSDNCSAVVITESEVSTKDPNAANMGHYNYTITRTWTATDVSGNASSCTQLITVEDVTNPSVTCLADVTVSCQDDNASAATGVATGSDNCSAVVITESEVSTQDINAANMGHYNYTITRTWTATDVSGNSSSCNQVITVQDVTNPTVSCPADVTINCQDDKTSAANGTATGSDNCSGVAITESDFSTQDANSANIGHYNYTITRTWTSTDVSGNASSCTQVITVEDITNPIITCPADIVVNNDPDECGSVSVSFAAMVSDNCSPITVDYTQNPNTLFPLGDTYVTATATDVSGNISSCTFTVTVNVDPSMVVAYTILAEEDVHLHEDNIVAGNVGVWKANKKAKLHKQSHIYGFLQAPDIDLKDGSTVSGNQTLAQAPMPSAASFKYNTLNGTVDVNVPNNYSGVYLITGNNFDKIKIGKNATAQFVSTGDIFIKELKVEGDKNESSNVLFSGNTDLMIKKKMELKKSTNFNQVGGHIVNVYVEDGDVKVEEGSSVTANIDARFKSLDVKGKKNEDVTTMNGRFIAQKIKGDKNVHWNGACQGPGNVLPSSKTTPSNTHVPTVVSAPGLEAEVYPNPNSGIFNIKISTQSEAPIQAVLYDLSGKKITALDGIVANTPYSVNRELTPGVYFIHIEVGGQRASIKMIKQD